MRKTAWLVTPIVAGCSRRAGLPPIPSPDGSIAPHTRIERSKADPGAYLCVVFEIRDLTGRVLHSENIRASDAMRWDMSWVADDRIRLRSSDIGTYNWHRQADGRWVKESPGIPPPGGQGRHGQTADRPAATP